ncbi:MAG: DUF2007 domain-containing protein [Desulfuromonadaceae bacterium]
MQKIFTPENEIELVMVKGLLEAAQIPFYVRNDHFGGLYIGPQIQHFNQRAIMVPPEYAARSKEIIAEFIATQQQVEPEPPARTERTPLLEKLRLLGEALLFCWIVPRRRKQPASGSALCKHHQNTKSNADAERNMRTELMNSPQNDTESRRAEDGK